MLAQLFKAFVAESFIDSLIGDVKSGPAFILGDSVVHSVISCGALLLFSYKALLVVNSVKHEATTIFYIIFGINN